MAESRNCNCETCPAFEGLCAGCNSLCIHGRCSGDCAACPVRCARRSDLDAWLEAMDGLALDAPLAPQPAFDLPPFFPQLLNGLEIPSMIAREAAIGVGIAKVLTPGGKVSRRALPDPYATRSLRAQWGIGDGSLLVCIGNYLDEYLERLWPATMGSEAIWSQVRALGFNAATSLNFSIYFDQPRMEHLINIKRTWLTVWRMQQTSMLAPIPHLQWYQPIDLERQLGYALAHHFHTFTLNLQIVHRRAWSPIAEGLPLIHARAPEARLLFAGVATLKRMSRLAAQFPRASFTNTTAHYLAQRYIRLTRHDGRLIKEAVTGHPDLVLADNVGLYREFIAERTLSAPQSHSPAPAAPDGLYATQQQVAAALQARFGYSPEQAAKAAERLAVDTEILATFQLWLCTGRLDREFSGSFPTWPCSDCLPDKPALGRLLDHGLSPVEAFLHLADLAHQVDEEIQVFVGQAGY